MFNAVAFTASICAVLLVERITADSEDASELKPHFLYMKRLRKHLDDSQISLPHTMDQVASDQGQLVATSIEAQAISGRSEWLHSIGSYNSRIVEAVM